jgi:hypothetical protein
MPDLFPETTSFSSDSKTNNVTTRINFGKSFKFDFETGDFVITPSGKFITTEHVEAWVEWCKKALMTTRYRFLAYSRNYGQEFESLVGKGLTRKAIESEIKRMTKDCLMADPRTDEVKNFTFDWQSSDAVLFTCEIYNVLRESAKIKGSAVIS